VSRDFRLLWVGEGVSLLGGQTTLVLLPLVAVVGYGAGPGYMGVLTAAAWLPWLVIGLPAGAWVDTWSARRVMLVSDVLAAGFLASIPVAALLGVLGLAQLVVVAAGNGCCQVFFRAAYPVLVRQVAPADQQEQAFARLYGTEQAMQISGPGLAGVLAQVGSAVWGLALDAVTYLFSAACLARMSPGPRPRRAPDQQPLRTRIKEGVDYLWQDRLLRFLVVMGGVSNFGLTGWSTLMVIFMVDHLELPPGGVGAVVAVTSIGGLVGAVLTTRVTRALGGARALRWLQLLAGPPALLIAVTGPGWGVALLVVGGLCVSAGVVAGNIIRGAWRNAYVPEGMIARQMTAAQFVNFGTMPVAALVAGALGSAIGVRETVVLMMTIHALACLSLWVSPLRGLREMPLPAERPADATMAP
jgi:Na+/melibiose symporter-like transporter